MSAKESARRAAPRPEQVPGGSDGLVRIGILGRMSVAVDGVDVTPRGPTQRRLIVALAVAARRGARLPIAELVDLVYGDQLPPRPRRSLATLVWRLRTKWGGQVIESDQYGYWLVTDRCHIDAADFEALLQQGSRLDRGGDRSAATAAIRQALAMWHSSSEEPRSFLPAAEAGRLTELRLGAMERLGELLAASAQHREAISLLEEVAVARPDWEHSQALLIGAHLEVGNTADAHRVCDRARRALIEQGIDPGPELSRAIGRLEDAPAVAAPLPVRTDEVAPEAEGLIGRATDLDTVTDAVATALRSRAPAVVAITGEAGIGKTTLVRAALARLSTDRRPPRTLTLQCDPRRTLPYAVFAPLVPDDDNASPLARLLGGDAGADPAVSFEVLHGELCRRLRALAEPAGLVMVVEDLHWAPGGTTDALAALLELAGTIPLAVVITTRRRSVDRRLTTWITRRTRLSGLDTDAVAELIGADREGAAAMRHLTGGNPLYVRQLQETGYATTTELPDDLRAAIDAHLQIVSAEVLGTLRIAAAVGDSFSLITLAALTGTLHQDLPTWRTQLDAAASYGLIRLDPAAAGSYQFVHALIREHLYAQLTAEEQTAAHAAIGRTLSRLAMSRPCPADLLAHHYMLGWPEVSTDEVVERLAAAGQAAAAQLDFTQAASHYRSALDYLAMDPQRSPDEDTARLLGAAAGACAAAGQTQSANELYQSQLQLATDAGMPRWRIFAALGAVRTHYGRRVGPEVTDHLVAAVSDACRTGAVADLPDLTGEALAAIQVYRPARAGELLTAATEVEPALAGRLRTAVWEHQNVQDQLATARRLVQDPTADPVGSWLRLWVSEVAAGLRALDDQPACPVPINDADEATRFDLTQWRIATTIATGHVERGHRMIDEALAAPPHPDPAENARRAASFYGQRTYLAVIAGDQRTAQQSPVLSNPTWASRHPIMRYVRAYMRAEAVSLGEAREECEDLLDEVRNEVIPDSDIVPRVLLLSRTCLHSGHEDGLEPCLELMLGHRGEHGIFRFGQYWGSVDGTIGRVYAALGDLDSAIDFLRAAVAGYARAHAYLDLKMVRAALVKTLERRARPDDVQQAELLRQIA